MNEVMNVLLDRESTTRGTSCASVAIAFTRFGKTKNPTNSTTETAHTTDSAIASMRFRVPSPVGPGSLRSKKRMGMFTL